MLEIRRAGELSAPAQVSSLVMALPGKQVTLLPAADALGDGDLVARALAGDRWSRDVIYRRHAHYLLAISARLLSSRSEGEEVVQDTFVVGFAQLGTLRDPGALRAWLARIAVSLVRRRMRRGRLLKMLGLDRSPDDATLAALATPTMRADDRAELALVDRLLRRMPANLRIAWMLRRVEGLPLAQVASACACSLATAKRRVAAADAEVARYVSFREETP